MPELRALTRECRLRGYSRLRKAELTAFLQDNAHPGAPQPPPVPQRWVPPPASPPPPPQMSTWEPIDDRLRQPEPEVLEEAGALGSLLHVPPTKRQLKRRQNRDSKLAKKFKSLDAEISNLKSQMEALKDTITKASKSTNAGFKRKKIKSMKREVSKINEKLRESKKKLELIEPRVTIDLLCRAPLKLHPKNRPKHIETKIAKLNKKIRRAKNRRNKECLIAKREALCPELNWGPRQLEGAFGSTYRRYRIDGITGMDPDTFFSRVRRFLIDLLRRE